jgi:hypothetical protein
MSVLREAGLVTWYQAYNAVKHDRDVHFKKATLVNVLDAVAGLLVILFAQFRVHAFDAYRTVTMFSTDGKEYGFGHCIFKLTTHLWAPNDKYEFEWKTLASSSDPFQTFPF